MSSPSYGNTRVKIKKNKHRDRFKLFFMALPFLILCFTFSYLPLYGWIYSMFDYRPPFKLYQCDFVGLKWITAIVTNPVYRNAIGDVLRNTFAISGLNLLTSVLPLAFAVFLNEVKRGWFKRIVQVLTTLPNFISWVLVYSVAYVFFSTGDGVVNKLLMDMHIISSPINFLASDNHTWLSMTLWSLWKTLGWSAIMYLAAIAGIDQELYEAAKVDGAGRFRMMWNITVPSLLPTFFVLLMLSVANFLNNGLDQYYVFQNAMNKAHIQVLDLYVYNIGVGSMNFPLATAVSMLKSIVSIALLFTVNGVSKLLRGETIV
ncbi:ABC transporter permease [Ruminiclostridium josui]|uniref:ABC transporter permease n=1 Tax=Ruminiclostridium josui TaxID=1499 RepID=UPI0004645BF4|nr:ABC transporter permease subunit [Ruminiclostridium josui]